MSGLVMKHHAIWIRYIKQEWQAYYPIRNAGGKALGKFIHLCEGPDGIISFAARL